MIKLPCDCEVEFPAVWDEFFVETDNKNQKDRDMMRGDDAQFTHWLMNDAKKYGVNGRKYR